MHASNSFFDEMEKCKKKCTVLCIATKQYRFVVCTYWHFILLAGLGNIYTHPHVNKCASQTSEDDTPIVIWEGINNFRQISHTAKKYWKNMSLFQLLTTYLNTQLQLSIYDNMLMELPLQWAQPHICEWIQNFSTWKYASFKGPTETVD